MTVTVADRTEDGSLPDGLERLYAEQRPQLLRFLTARLGNAAAAEDVLQDIWFKLRGGASGPVANGRAYLYRVAHNAVLDRVREERRRAARDRAWADQAFSPAGADGEVADAAPTADRIIEDREEEARIVAAVAALPEGALRVFRLHKIEGLSHGEVAARLGISRSGVEKHMAVAMKHLRRSLGD